MSVRCVIDTNILVYAEDSDEPVKREIAREVLGVLTKRQAALVTSQVLGEYFVTVVRKFPERLGPDNAMAQVERLLALMPTLETSVRVVMEALRGVVRYRLSYYDAQIWAAAKLAGIPVVLSEDFSSGTELDGVRFLDPFEPGFDVEVLLTT